MGKDGLSVFIFKNDLRPRRLVANLQSDHALIGITEALRHASCAGADKGAAGNHAGFIVVQGRGITLRRTF